MKKNYQLSATRAIGVKNAATPEGQQFADEILAAINEAFAALNADEAEHAPEDFKAAVLSALEGLDVVPEAIQEFVKNAIELKMKAVANVAKAQGVSREVKNEICHAIISFHGEKGEELKNNIDAICKKNGVSGLTFGDVIDYKLVDKFGKEDALFNQFTQTRVSRFFYSTNDMSTAAAIAKQWSKSSQVSKDIQTLEETPKTITTAYVYKRQQVALEDLDEIRRAGDESGFIAYITEELSRVLVNTVVMAILVGDAVNSSGKKLTNFESIATKSATDAFTIVATAAATVPTVAEVRAQADLIYNPNGAKKVAIMSAATKTALAGYKYTSTSDTWFRNDEELAGQLGVDEIYTTDLMNNKGVVVMLPAEYWILEKNAIEVAYPTWQDNVNNWQVERNIGGKIHGLLSTAYIKPHE